MVGRPKLEGNTKHPQGLRPVDKRAMRGYNWIRVKPSIKRQ